VTVGQATSVGDAARETALRLEAAGCETPHVDAEWLLAHILGASRSEVRARSGQLLTEGREPLAYVLGEWGFRRLALRVDERALVPRPETEIVVERCLLALAGVDEPAVLDVGTGSGAIALAIADEHPGTRVKGLDLSDAALSLAWENARRTGLDVTFVHGDLHDGLPAGPWDLVVSNPPYVDPGDLDGLAPEVRNWEPREALVDDGATRAIACCARDVLRPGGMLVLESAEAKADSVASELQALGYVAVEIARDLSGQKRVVEGVRP
jgi:release factor glutamine methyltransferase